MYASTKSDTAPAAPETQSTFYKQAHAPKLSCKGAVGDLPNRDGLWRVRICPRICAMAPTAATCRYDTSAPDDCIMRGLKTRLPRRRDSSRVRHATQWRDLSHTHIAPVGQEYAPPGHCTLPCREVRFSDDCGMTGQDQKEKADVPHPHRASPPSPRSVPVDRTVPLKDLMAAQRWLGKRHTDHIARVASTGSSHVPREQHHQHRHDSLRLDGRGVVASAVPTKPHHHHQRGASVGPTNEEVLLFMVHVRVHRWVVVPRLPELR